MLNYVQLNSHANMISPDQIKAQLDNALIDATISELPNHYLGKVRDCYTVGDKRILISTDRQSAFDRTDFPAVPFKGQVLAQTAKFWFEQTTDLCANQVISYPDPNVIVAKELNMIPVEVIVRAYMTGSTETSIWPMYEGGKREMYGHTFPEGLVKNAKLPEVIITPTTKDERDMPLDVDAVPAEMNIDAAVWAEICEKALAVFKRGQEIAAKNGLILVDTKYEFGLDENGTVTLADEIHTPDSSRYWKVDSYEARLAAGDEPESLDKEFLRLWVKNNRADPYDLSVPMDIPAETVIEFSGKYIELYEAVTGQDFVAPEDNQPVLERIKKNLGEYF